jgi:hypothetical protein
MVDTKSQCAFRAMAQSQTARILACTCASCTYHAVWTKAPLLSRTLITASATSLRVAALRHFFGNHVICTNGMIWSKCQPHTANCKLDEEMRVTSWCVTEIKQSHTIRFREAFDCATIEEHSVTDHVAIHITRGKGNG